MLVEFIKLKKLSKFTSDGFEAMAFELDHLFIWTDMGAYEAERLVSFGLVFSSWAYHPPYLPKTMSIEVGKNSGVLTEPWLFQTPFGQRPDRYPVETSQPLDHGMGLREITRVELVSPAANHLSPELQAVVNTTQIKLRLGTEYFIELGFDGEVQGKQVDFRPGLPLIISW